MVSEPGNDLPTVPERPYIGAINQSREGQRRASTGTLRMPRLYSENPGSVMCRPCERCHVSEHIVAALETSWPGTGSTFSDFTTPFSMIIE